VFPLFAILIVCPPWTLAKEPWIIDTHTHFKGIQQIAHEAKTNRRHPNDTLGQVVLPEDYRTVANRLRIQATVIVEAVEQDQPHFNDWVLDQAKSDLVCGYVARGNLAGADFLNNYQRYRKTGYLLGYRFRFDELHGYLDNPTARQQLRRLESDGMVVDLLIEFGHAEDVTRLAREFPKLKIVINHCFKAKMKNGHIGEEWQLAVKACAKYPNVFCKLSSILNFSEVDPFTIPAPTELNVYLPVMQRCFAAFGEDRMIFATNWGVCTHFGRVDDVVHIVTEFLNSKGKSALKKGMRENAIRIYGIPSEHLR
jgi:predicted TIM-barrel fold metal-dependent hydrolase